MSSAADSSRVRFVGLCLLFIGGKRLWWMLNLMGMMGGEKGLMLDVPLTIELVLGGFATLCGLGLMFRPKLGWWGATLFLAYVVAESIWFLLPVAPNPPSFIETALVGLVEAGLLIALLLKGSRESVGIQGQLWTLPVIMGGILASCLTYYIFY